MTYLNPQSAPLNDDITRFVSVDLNGSYAIFGGAESLRYPNDSFSDTLNIPDFIYQDVTKRSSYP